MDQINEPMEAKGISYGRFIKLVLWIFAIEMAISFAVGMPMYGIEKLGLDGFSRYSGAVGSIVTCFILLERFCYKRSFKLRVTYLPKVQDLFIITGLLFGYTLVFSNTIGLVLEEVEVASWVLEAFEDLAKAPIALVLDVAILAPIIEEVIYRGIFLEYLSQRYGNVKALVLSSGIFAIVHFNLHQSVNAFLLGLILGIIYLRTKSLLHSIIVHMINNGIVVAMMLTFPTQMTTDAQYGFEWSSLLIGLLFLGLGLRYIYKYQPSENRRIQLKDTWHKYFMDEST